jgi:CRP/FNR family transcriptional regulator, cyclic AMP receptor protein
MIDNKQETDEGGTQPIGNQQAAVRRSAPAKVYKEGNYIFRDGESGQEAFILKSGKVEIFKIITRDGRTEENSLAILSVGTMFGEMALIDDKPRMASARAYGGPVTVMCIDQQQFRKMLEPVNPFIKKLLSILADHVRGASKLTSRP